MNVINYILYCLTLNIIRINFFYLIQYFSDLFTYLQNSNYNDRYLKIGIFATVDIIQSMYPKSFEALEGGQYYIYTPPPTG